MTLDMEIDSGAECSTIPWWIFHGKLANAYKLVETSVTLRQYDQSPLAVKGECHATVEVNDYVFEAVFIVVDMPTQYPLFGRDWMSCIGFDVTSLLQEATQVHCSSEGTMSVEAILSKYSNIFKDELGILKEIEASIDVEQGLFLNSINIVLCHLLSMRKLEQL